MNAKNVAVVTLGLLSVLAAAAPNSSDTKFVASIAEGNTFESRGGKLALDKSNNGSLRDYGTTLVSAHGHAQEKLAGLAKDKGLSLPGGLTAADQKLVDKLDSLKGDEFNRAYKRAVVAHHRHAIKTIQAEIRHGKDPDVLAYAKETLTMVQGHLRTLEAIKV